MLDARMNIFFGLTLGVALMWELNLVLRIEDWRMRVGKHVRGWLDAIGEFEALASLGAFAHERPDYVMPELVVEDGYFDVTDLAHPLIDRKAVITNDLRIVSKPNSSVSGRLILLSGSNMSGKSTLLRSIGLSYVLARMGSVVPASRMQVSDFRLLTSMRIVDSLASGTSHFYAELRKLKSIVDAAKEKKPPLLYLLDEVLHGTNSRERYIGAVSVIRWLTLQGAFGVVTTHDLALAKVEELLPTGAVKNYHFSDDMINGQLRFDYKLRQGPVESTNALRLMQSVGIDVELVEAHAP